jgi:hypothetical protein
MNTLDDGCFAIRRSLSLVLLGPLPEMVSWSEMPGHLFRFTYLAAICLAMVGWICLFAAIFDWIFLA